MQARSEDLVRFLAGLVALAAFAAGSFVLGWTAYG